MAPLTWNTESNYIMATIKSISGKSCNAVLSGSPKSSFLSIDGKRCGVNIVRGPWIKRSDDMIKIRSKRTFFPRSFIEFLPVENESNMMIDYFEKDTFCIYPGHALYEDANKLAS